MAHDRFEKPVLIPVWVADELFGTMRWRAAVG
jgi:hypothetical protein